MKKSIQTALLVITLVSFNFSQAFLDISKEELKSRSAALTSKGTHRRLSRAHSLLGKDKINDALDIRGILISTRDNPAPCTSF